MKRFREFLSKYGQGVLILIVTLLILKSGLGYISYEVFNLKRDVRDIYRIISGKADKRDEMPRLPSRVKFCGRTIFFDENQDLRERVEKEFYNYLGQPNLLIFYAKMKAKYFPLIEKKLRENDLPDDLKFIVMLESKFDPNAVSKKEAVGIWQLMAGTARALRLRVDTWVDERLDPIRSTEKILKLFKELYSRFDDWFLVLAAYNWNPKDVEELIKKQGERDYFKLIFNKETDRYNPQAIAIKIIFSNLEEYGICLSREDGYQFPEFEETTILVKNWLTVKEIARASGSYFREIKLLNPWIKNDRLPKGKYKIRLPDGKKEVFAMNFKGKIIKENRGGRMDGEM
jgi:hypothetical protein